MSQRRKAGLLLMLVSGLMLVCALLLLFRPLPLSRILSPPGEGYRPYFLYSQIRVYDVPPVNLTTEETAALLAILEERQVVFWGVQQTEPYLDKNGTPQLFHIYFSRNPLSMDSNFSFDGQLTYLTHRGCFWADRSLYLLLDQPSRDALSALLQAHYPLKPQ